MPPLSVSSSFNVRHFTVNHFCTSRSGCKESADSHLACRSEKEYRDQHETTSSISASTGADRAATPSEVHRSAGRLTWRCDDDCTIDIGYRAERTSASTARETSRRYRDCLLAAIHRNRCPAQRCGSSQRRAGAGISLLVGSPFGTNADVLLEDKRTARATIHCCSTQ